MSVITLCSSATFFGKLPQIKDALASRGHEVLLPSMQDYHELKEQALAKIVNDLIRKHFAKIEKSDAIYVANYEKKEIAGYIGGNTFLEMGKAFDVNIPIFLANELPMQISYREELLAMKPVIVGQDWEKMENCIASWKK